MAIYKIFPTKDATLYSEFPNMNTGLDEIIEASTYVKEEAGQVSRYLIQFSTSEMNNIINTKTVFDIIKKLNQMKNSTFSKTF